jgi:hypothetical protein
MTIALVALLVIIVLAAGFLIWKSRDTWRWYQLTAAAMTLILAITLLFPTAGVLKSRAAWNKVKEELDVRLARIEDEQRRLKYGDPGDAESGQGVLELQSQLQRFALEAGRRWPNLRMQGNRPDSITLLSAAPAALPPGIVPDEPPAGGQAPAATNQPLIPQGLVVYGFAESAEPGVNVPVPSFFLGEFRVTASGPGQVTIAPVGPLEGPQQQAIAGGKAQSWTLYELLPLDSHTPFIAPGSEPADDALFGRVDDELVKRMLGKSVTPATLSKYLRDGERAKPDDPPSTRWVKIEFLKPHSIVVDSPEKRNVLDGGFFDGTGQAVDSRLQRGEDGTAKFRTGDQIVVKEESSTELIEQGVAKLLDTYFVRPLHDYRFVLRRIRLRISELAIRQQELEYEGKVLQDAIDATVIMLAANQDAKLKLENDIAKIQTEREAIKTYTDKVRTEVAQTRQRLVGLYQQNLELAAELKEYHRGIAASLP